ncbi:tRNA epoxyqueuosine(34) reductase QueG, partial [Staphylococcus aureus]
MATSISDSRQQKLKRFLIEEAKAAGFDAVAFTTPDAIPQAPERLRQYIADGHHADMDWMEETEARRADPSVLWPEVRSIMMLAMNYGPDANPLAILEKQDRAAIS